MQSPPYSFSNSFAQVSFSIFASMLAIFLACVLAGQTAQPQANSEAQSATDPSHMSLAERAASARKAAADDPSQMSLAERAAATRKADADDPSHMSLAERAAAARKAAAAERANHGETSRVVDLPNLTPEQRGTVRGNAYVNDILHFRVALNQWQPLISERMARAEDTARRLVNPEDHASPYRVLWIGDNVGRNIALSVMPTPPDAPKDLKQINESMKKIAIRQLALATDVTESEEPFLLGNASHPFAGFRVTATIHGQQIVQSSQVTLVHGFLMSFTVTGDSDQDLSDALRSLKSSLAWTGTGP